MTLRRLVHPTLALCALVLVPVGCADEEETSLCAVYEDLLAARDTAESVDPTAGTAGEIEVLVEDYRDQVRRLREVADHRYVAAIDALDVAVSDVLLTLASLQDSADYATWAPLLEDSLEEAAAAAAVVSDRIDPACRPDR